MGQKRHARESAQDHAIIERRIAMLKARVKGRKTMQDLADEFGVAVSTVYKDIHWMIDRNLDGVSNLVEKERQLECDRLDEWQKASLLKLDETDDLDDLVKIMTVLMKIAERKAKLMGYDTPVKQQIEATLEGVATPAKARELMKQFFSGDVTPRGEDDDEPESD